MGIDCFEGTLTKSIGKVYAPTRYVALNGKRDYVVVVHGLGFSKFFLSNILKALEKKGYAVVEFKYTTNQYPVDVLANELLASHIKRYCIDRKKKINFVTHSLGGILVRKYLADNPSTRVGRVVMMAPPNHGSRMADFFSNTLLFKWLYGPAGQQLGSSKDSYVNLLKGKINYELGIIAGRRCINPISMFLIKEDNDGMVTVNSTKLKGMRDNITVNFSHLLMLRSAFVIKQVLTFLDIGCFKE